MNVAMLLLASGRGERLGAGIPKAYVEVEGEPLVVRSARRLAQIPCTRRQLVLAASPADRQTHVADIESALTDAGVDHIVDGGETRQASMLNAFRACDADADLILVHDAARPFFDPQLALQALETAAQHGGGALLATRVTDTLKQATRVLDVTSTVDRSTMWAAQTPQVVTRKALETALQASAESGFEGTDDVSLLEHAGIRVTLIESTTRNLKVTTPADLALASHYARLESPS